MSLAPSLILTCHQTKYQCFHWTTKKLQSLRKAPSGALWTRTTWIHFQCSQSRTEPGTSGYSDPEVPARDHYSAVDKEGEWRREKIEVSGQLPTMWTSLFRTLVGHLRLLFMGQDRKLSYPPPSLSSSDPLRVRDLRESWQRWRRKTGRMSCVFCINGSTVICVVEVYWARKNTFEEQDMNYIWLICGATF